MYGASDGWTDAAMAAKRCWGAFSEFGSEPSPQSADFDSLNQILLGFGRWFTHDGRARGALELVRTA